MVSKYIKKLKIIKSKVVFFIGTVIVLILVFTNLILAYENDNSKTLLTINNEDIIISEFMINYDNNIESSLEKLIENRALLNILKRYEIIESTDYNDILNGLEQENERRLEAKENNEIIYGPIQYTPKQYYEYILSNGQAELEFIIEDKFKEEINSKIQLIYEENIEDFKIEDAVECEILSISFINEDGSVNDVEKEKAKVLLEEIRMNFDESDFKLYENVYKEKYEFNYENKALDENYKAELKEKALELQVGDVSEVIEFNGSYHILKCLNRYNQGYEKLDVVRDQIIVDEIDSIINELIKEEKESMRIEINEEVLNEIGDRQKN